MTEPVVLVDRRDNVLLVTINRPTASNAINQDVTRLLGDALDQADRDRAIRAVVLTGAGDRTFCAGADLKALAAGQPSVPRGREHWGFAGVTRHFISTPVVVAVNGAALGGGLEICLAGDLVVASETARFGLPEVKRGIIATAGGVLRLPAQLPRKLAMQMILTGEPIDAATAYRWGLVNTVVPQSAVLDEALALAERIADNAPLAVQASKRIAYQVRDGESWLEDDAWRINTAERAAIMDSNDAHEGPLAFAEKRAPQWTGN